MIEVAQVKIVILGVPTSNKNVIMVPIKETPKTYLQNPKLVNKLETLHIRCQTLPDFFRSRSNENKRMCSLECDEQPTYLGGNRSHLRHKRTVCSTCLHVWAFARPVPHEPGYGRHSWFFHPQGSTQCTPGELNESRAPGTTRGVSTELRRCPPLETRG